MELFKWAQGERFRIREVDLGTKGKVGLVPSGLNYIINIFRGQIPSWDPYAIQLRIMREPAITKDYDYVICDTPPELFPPTLWGLYAADYIIVPSNYEELSLAGVKLLLREVIPEVIMRSRKEPKVLGVTLINVTKKLSKGSLTYLNNAIYQFIRRRMPSTISRHIHSKPLFSSIIYRHSDLKDLVYRPRRLGLPLNRVIARNSELKDEIDKFTGEVLERISNFTGVGL